MSGLARCINGRPDTALAFTYIPPASRAYFTPSVSGGVRNWLRSFMAGVDRGLVRICCCGAGAAYTLPIVRSLANYTLISLTHERAAQAAAAFAAIGGPRLALKRVEATRGRAEDLTSPPSEGEMGNVKIEVLATHPQGLLSMLSPPHATRRNSCGGLWLSKSRRDSRSGFLFFISIGEDREPRMIAREGATAHVQNSLCKSLCWARP